MTPQDAMQYFGSQNKMAKAFGVTPPAVLRWRKAGRFPKRREYELPLAIERHRTKGEAIRASKKTMARATKGALQKRRKIVAKLVKFMKKQIG